MPLTVEQLIQNVEESGLMTADEVRLFLRELPVEKKDCPADDLARELARQGKLTPWQATQIYNGRQAGLQYGNYIVLDKLGEGGMGMVFKARHRVMQRTVALKVLSPKVTKDPMAVKRFQREVRASAVLTHPNIVNAFDADEVSNVHFLVMEYVDGKDLSAFVKKYGPLSVEQAIDCLLQAARGLEFAHSKGIVHRDIKPSNLLLDSNGNVKVLDLGLARFQTDGPDAGLTNTGTAMGTIDYMAPEQALDSKQADHRADIYSLGISLWFLLTRKPAYDGTTLMEKLLAHRQDPIPDLRSCRDDVSDALNRVFQRMVAKTPQERYQSMTEVILDLESARSEGSASSLNPRPLLAATGGDERAMNALLAGTGASVANMKAAPTTGEADESNFAQRTLATILPIGRFQTLVSEKMAQVARQIPPSRLPYAVASAAVVVLLFGSAIFLMRGDRHRNQPSDAAQSPPVLNGSPTRFAVDESTTTNAKADSPSAPLTVGLPAPADFPFSADQAAMHQQNWARYLERQVVETNSLGMDLVLIPPGGFRMGLSNAEIDELLRQDPALSRPKFEAELPQHDVHISQAFFLGKTEVAQSEYQSLMDENPSHFSAKGGGKLLVGDLETGRFPVENVSWFDAVEFCNRLSAKEGIAPYYRCDNVGRTAGSIRQADVSVLGGNGYRLPTESEWEYACRAGTTTLFHFGNVNDGGQANVNGNSLSGATRRSPSLQRTNTLGAYPANAWGLFDMHGNVWEWCSDLFDENAYKNRQSASGATTAGSAGRRVLRGGSWNYSASESRAAYRYGYSAGNSDSDFGFRVARTISRTSPATDVAVPLPAKPPQQRPSGENDRAVANWVTARRKALSVEFRAKRVTVSKPEDLPAEPFYVTSIDLWGTRISDDEMQSLRGLYYLENLMLDGGGVTDTDCKVLGAVKSLRSLSVNRNRITDAGLAELSGLLALTGIGLEANPITDDGLRHVARLSSLRSLNLYNTAITGDGLKHLAGHTQLYSLVLRKSKVTEEGLQPLAGLPALAFLDIGEMTLTEPGLKTLGTLKNLSSLGLVQAKIDEGGLQHLSSIPLRTLTLNESNVTDEGLKSLSGCRLLITLGLDKTSVTDVGLTHLHGLTTLRSLSLHGTKVTAAGVAPLQKALPNCKVYGDESAVPPVTSAESDSGPQPAAGMTSKQLPTFSPQTSVLSQWPTRSSQLVRDKPKQTAPADNNPFRIAHYRITPLVDYEIAAVVLSKKRYPHEQWSDFFPWDMVLGWGKMSDPTVIRRVTIRQENRFLTWSADALGISEDEVNQSIANVHLVPADEKIAGGFDTLPTGAVVTMKGSLVSVLAVQYGQSREWRSSLSRTDTGQGACEVIYVRQLTIRTPGKSPMIIGDSP